MTSSPKIVGEEKGCGPCLALTTHVFHICLSLFGPYLAAAAWVSVKLLWRMVKRSLWFDVGFFCASYQNAAAETQGEEGDEESLALLPLCLFILLSLFVILLLFFLSCFFLFLHPLPFISFIISLLPLWLFSCPPLRPSILPSIYFILSLTYPPFPPSLFLFPSLSPRFCLGWVEVISHCVTLAMCRQWMGLWQRLNSLGPQWQRLAGEGNNYTYTWEDLRLFTKWKKWDSGYFIYCFIFAPLDWWPSR